MKRFWICLVFMLLTGFFSTASAEVVDVSVCDVLANPQSFDGKTIRLNKATVIAGFDEFLIEGSGCTPAAAIWLSYPAGTKAKAGPAALLRLQLAKNSALVAEAPRRAPVTLERNSDFQRFDTLLATPSKSSGKCLGCSRYTVVANLVGRLDGVKTPGLERDKEGKPIGLAGFGNMNLYRARLVLQAVSDVTPHEVDAAENSAAIRGDIRRAESPPAPDQVARALHALGEEGDDNGVVVSNGVDNEVPMDEGLKGKYDSPDGILFLVTIDMDRLKKKTLSWAIAHLGTHIADVRGGVVSMEKLDEAESRAWRATFLR